MVNFVTIINTVTRMTEITMDAFGYKTQGMKSKIDFGVVPYRWEVNIIENCTFFGASQFVIFTKIISLISQEE